LSDVAEAARVPRRRERESVVPSVPRGRVEGVGDTLPREEEGVGEVRWRFLSPFFRAALPERMRFLWELEA
jgi:hypothetical protein